MQNFVIDTNILFNLEEIKDLGSNTTELLSELNPLIEALSKNKQAEFFIPHSVYDEINSFFEQQPIELKNFFTLVNIKSPEREKIMIPGNFLHELINDIRQRTFRALKIAEEQIRQSYETALNRKNNFKNSKEKELFFAPFINKLRERFRKAIRTNFLDSPTDVDVLLLAKELNAYLTTTDEGVLIWAKKLGVKTIPAVDFKAKLLSLM
ncbi:MAG: UPF0278 protein [Patescibacteria group bacterium]|nr:MAG: UPF0278 protein [Patescibacteria group bacterium]